jgi:hypothetical protein
MIISEDSFRVFSTCSLIHQITKISTGTIDFKITVEKTNRKKLSELLRQFF